MIKVIFVISFLIGFFLILSPYLIDSLGFASVGLVNFKNFIDNILVFLKIFFESALSNFYLKTIMFTILFVVLILKIIDIIRGV